MDEFRTKPIRVQEILEVIAALPPRAESEEAPSPSAEAIVPSSLADLGELVEVDDPEFLRELVDTYLADVVADSKTIATGADIGDAPSVMNAAHKLKSSSRMMGAPALGELAAEMEIFARNGGIPDDESLHVFTTECHRVVEALTLLVARNVSS